MSIIFISPAFPSKGAGGEAAQAAIWEDGVWANCVWANGVWIEDTPGCEAAPGLIYGGAFIARRRTEDLARITL